MDISDKKINRREFIGHGAKLALAASVLNAGIGNTQVKADATQKLKLALVGTGSRGTSSKKQIQT